MSYADYRSIIEDGDVLLFESSGWIARSIRWATRSRFSHAALTVWVGDRIMVAESRELKGCRLVPLSSVLAGKTVSLFKPHPLLAHDVSHGPASALDRNAVRNAAFDRLGQSYGYWSIVLMLLQKLPLVMLANSLGIFQHVPVVGRVIPKWGQLYSEDDLREPTTHLVCSAYVAWCWRKGGVDLVKNLSDRNTTPGDLARSLGLFFVGKLS